MLRAIILGPPGSGKGTLSGMIAERFKLKHVSSGDLLRTHLNPAHSKIKEGKLVEDSLVEKIVFPVLQDFSRDGRGWLLDGFPRTLSQSESLLIEQKVHMVINLLVPDQTIISRLHGRWVHIASGRTYHDTFNPPKVKGVDDQTGEPLQQREDDTIEVIQQRLRIYHNQITPLTQYFDHLGILRSYSGTSSKKIWPLIEEDIATFLKSL